MWPFKRKKESDGPIPYSSTPPTPTPPPSAPQPPAEPRNWAVVVLDKHAGSGSRADLDMVLMADLHLERGEMGDFYHSEPPFVVVQNVTRKFAENAVQRLALAGVQAKAETMSAATTTPAPVPTKAEAMQNLREIIKAGIANANNPNLSSLQQGDYSVVLVDSGRKKIEVIKVIRAETQLGLQEAKKLAESTPSTIVAGISADDAEMIAREFQRVEAVVQIMQGSTPINAPAVQNLLAGDWSVVLLATGPKKINIIKTIREITDLGLAEAKKLSESTPATLISGVAQAYAQQIAMQLQEDGATAQIIQPAQNQSPAPVTLPTVGASPSAPVVTATNGWNVILTDAGRNKIAVIKVIRQHLHNGLAEAKDLADKTPSLLANQLDEASAHQMARDLQIAGATVQVSPS